MKSSKNFWLTMGAVVFFALVISPFILQDTFFKQRKLKSHVERIYQLNGSEVNQIAITVLYSDRYEKKTYLVDPSENENFIRLLKASEVSANQIDRLLTTEEFEVRIQFKNAEDLCFALLNSQKRGGVIRILSDCDMQLVIGRMQSKGLLGFVHEKFSSQKIEKK